MNPPLRFQDEFVRHKVLDLIGDLALIGHQILGNVVADRAGHAMHTALVSRLLRDPSLWEETTLSEERAVEYLQAEAAAGAVASRRLVRGVRAELGGLRRTPFLPAGVFNSARACMASCGIRFRGLLMLAGKRRDADGQKRSVIFDHADKAFERGRF